MTTYQEAISTINNILDKINSHLYTLNHDERFRAWSAEDTGKPTLVVESNIGNVRNITLHLDIDPMGPNYLTVKDFTLTISHIVNSGDDIIALKHLTTKLEELHQTILTRTSGETLESSKILRYWGTLIERLNEASRCLRFDDMFPKYLNIIAIPVGEHFKIILEFQHDSQGVVFTSCKVDFHDFNTELTRVDGYLLAIEPMLEFIALAESKRDKDSVSKKGNNNDSIQC